MASFIKLLGTTIAVLGFLLAPLLSEGWYSTAFNASPAAFVVYTLGVGCLGFFVGKWAAGKDVKGSKPGYFERRRSENERKKEERRKLEAAKAYRIRRFKEMNFEIKQIACGLYDKGSADAPLSVWEQIEDRFGEGAHECFTIETSGVERVRISLASELRETLQANPELLDCVRERKGL